MVRHDELILREIQRDERIVSRFWQLVSKGDSGNSCWHWQGRVSKRSPALQVGRLCTQATRVAWWTATGSFPMGGRFYRTCDNDLCVRPDHLAWSLGKSAERVQDLDSSGYFVPSGVAMRVAVVAGERPQMFRFVSREAAALLPLAG